MTKYTYGSGTEFPIANFHIISALPGLLSCTACEKNHIIPKSKSVSLDEKKNHYMQSNQLSYQKLIQKHGL